MAAGRSHRHASAGQATYPGLPNYSLDALDALIEHVRPDLTQAPAQRHRATYDAFATAQLLLAMAAL